MTHLFELASINFTSKNSLSEQHHRLFNRPERGARVDLRLVRRRHSAAFHPKLNHLIVTIDKIKQKKN